MEHLRPEFQTFANSCEHLISLLYKEAMSDHERDLLDYYTSELQQLGHNDRQSENGSLSYSEVLNDSA